MKKALSEAAETPSTEAAATPTRSERGTGTSITIDLKEYQELLEAIRTQAKADDREPSKYLRRRLVQLHAAGELIA